MLTYLVVRFIKMFFIKHIIKTTTIKSGAKEVTYNVFEQCFKEFTVENLFYILKAFTDRITEILSQPVFTKFPRSQVNQVQQRYKTEKTIDHVKLGSRPPCPPPLLPPKPPPKDDSLFWGLCAIGVCTATFAVFAKSNPEIRDWLSIHAPWFDDMIAFVYEENYSHSSYIECKIKELAEFISKITNMDEEPCRLDSKGNKIEIKKKTMKGCETPAAPVVTKDICEVEACLRVQAEDMLNNMNTAKTSCLSYNQLVQEYMTDFSFPKLQELRERMNNRKKLVETSLRNAEKARKKMDILMEYLDCGVEASKDQIDSTKQMVDILKEKTRKEDLGFQWANDQALACDEQWQMVESLVKKYVDENKTVYPRLDYEAKGSYLEDPDVFLYHTYRYIKYLRCKLADAQSRMSLKAHRGVELSLPQDEQSRKNQLAMIDAAAKVARAEIDKDMKNRLDELKKRNDLHFKERLMSIHEANEKELEQKLAEREEELQSKLDEIVAEKVAAEIGAFQAHRKAIAERLRIVEDELNERVKADNEMKRCKDLWTAGNALLEATSRGDGVINVQKELKAVERAGKGDELVVKIMKALPKNVREKGLIPANLLRDKYKSMERVASRVALVDEEGAPLPIYFLSWIQSALLFLNLSEIPKAEALEKPPPEVSPSLDTFDLLNRSRYWVEKGNISLALKYLNALEGASRVATESWRQNATSYLEIRQAAEAVIAHAAAIGLKHTV